MIEEVMERCEWVNLDNGLYVDYHDEEWGVPVHDDQELFEFLILEGAQAGLSWETVLKKRAHYREAFDSFDPQKVAEYGEEKIQQLLQNEGIIRNELKIRSAVQNAQAFLKIQEEYGSFDNYIWDYVGDEPIQNSYDSLEDIPAKTELSNKISRDLKDIGMNFVGPTIIYAFMQAVGMVNDHQESCFRNTDLEGRKNVLQD